MYNSTGVFRVDPTNRELTPIAETDLATHGFKERQDLQEWVERHPDVLDEDLLIIGKEYNFFDGTNERVDLVALDRSGNVVVIELKRDDSGRDVHWQAIKYASYFSRAKWESIVEMYAKYKGQLALEEATQQIERFLKSDGVTSLNRDQRIILVSHRFAREVTSAVLWLRDRHSVDIKCVQLLPFADTGTGSFYLQAKTIIPVPGTEDYIVNLGLPSVDPQPLARYSNQSDAVSAYMAEVVETACRGLGAPLCPDRRSKWAGEWGPYRYYKAWYSRGPWLNHEFSYQTHIVHESGQQRDYTVKFEINTGSAARRGLSTEDIGAIRSAAEDYAKEQGLLFVDRDNIIRVEASFPIDALDDDLKAKVSAALQNMIQRFTPLVDSIMESHSQ